ncbi:hypothetical protein RRG08_052138, partial [Elysia crispata]
GKAPLIYGIPGGNLFVCTANVNLSQTKTISSTSLPGLPDLWLLDDQKRGSNQKNVADTPVKWTETQLVEVAPRNHARVNLKGLTASTKPQKEVTEWSRLTGDSDVSWPAGWSRDAQNRDVDLGTTTLYRMDCHSNVIRMSGEKLGIWGRGQNA